MGTLDTFIGQKPTGSLYHYTSAAGLIGIVQKGNLWASDYRHLNDCQEYRLGVRLLQNEVLASGLDDEKRAVFDKLVAQAKRGCFVASFSESRDQLSQWRAYCPGGNGYSLGFGAQNPLFASAEQHRFNLVRCEYDRSRQRELCQYLVQTFIDGMVSNGTRLPREDTASRIRAFVKRYNWGLALALVVSAVKHPGFEEEKEWRLVSQYPDEALYGVSFRPGRFGVTPFFELPTGTKDSPSLIDEITIGPTLNQRAARAALDLLFSKSGTPIGSIKLSNTPLRH
jgi:hypothetical protein